MEFFHKEEDLCARENTPTRNCKNNNSKQKTTRTTRNLFQLSNHMNEKKALRI